MRLAALLLALCTPALAQEAEVKVDGRTPQAWLELLTLEDGALASRRPEIKVGDILDVLSAQKHVEHTVPALIRAIGAESTQVVAVHALRKVVRSVGRSSGDAWAMKALAHVSKPAALQSLVKLLGHKDVHVRSNACFVLYFAGPGARTIAVPALIRALNDKGWRLRHDAAVPLGRIGGPKALKALTAALADPDDLIVESAARGLRHMGRPAAPAVPALIKALKRAPKPLPPGVLEIRGGHRACAASALGSIGPKARAAVPALIQALYIPDDAVRRAAALSLARVGTSKTVLPALRTALGDDSAQVRRYAAYAIAAFGPKASAALSDLETARKEERNIATRRALDRAIQAVQMR